MRWMLLIVGIGSLLMAALAVPFGVGERGAIGAKVYSNYQSLVARGLATDYSMATGDLIKGVTPMLSQRHTWEAGGHIVAGIVLLVAAHQWPKTKTKYRAAGASFAEG